MMKTQTLLFLSAITLMASCAQRGAPTGGPKDEQAPVLVTTIPAHESLNYKGEKVVLTFDEYIETNNLEKELIISPRIDQEYKTKVVKNRLEIEFKEPLEANTTYVFEFNKGIKDITEGNTAANPTLAFSTGSNIDTLKIEGQVKTYMTQQPAEGKIVALYKANDTLDLFNSKPLYFSKTDAEGKYTISYLKAGEYMLYSFADQNNDLVCKSANEAYGFHPEAINISEQNQPAVDLQLYKLNVSELSVQNARPSAQYFDIRFPKAVTDYQLKAVKESIKLYSNLQEDNKVIRVYPTKNLAAYDSLAATVFAIDSASNVTEDTVYIKFFEGREDPAEFTTQFKPASKSKVVEEFTGVFTFSKPITTVHADSLFFQYDSLAIVPIDMEKDAEWNKHMDQLTIRKTLDRTKVTSKADILEEEEDELAEEENVDNEVDKEEELENRPNRKKKKENQPTEKQPAPIDFTGKVRLNAAKGTFMSVENDSSQLVDNFYSFKDSKEYATLKGQIKTDHQHFIIQLLDKDYKIVDEIQDQKDYAFEFVKPGEYFVRVLVDSNDNGVWEYGNILKLQAPEQIYITKNKISLRENWEVGEIDFEF